MASEMDKFVLQYEVSMKDAISRLEQLQEKVTDVNQKTDGAKNKFKEFGTQATDEIGKIVPGVDKVSGAVRVMSAEFAAAGVAIAVLAVGVKSVIALRDRYGQQRIAGMDTGISGLRMEEYQRKFVKNSNGNVSRELAQDQIRSLSERLQGAYADPTRISHDNLVFKNLGVNIGERGQGPIPFNQSLTQLATNFSKMTPEQVQGKAKAAGINPDFALSLRNLGASVGRVTELTNDEIKKRQESEETLRKFNDELAKLNEVFTELEISLGAELLPAFTKLVEIVKQIVDLIPKDSIKQVGNKAQEQLDFYKGKEAPSTSFWDNLKRHPIAGGGPLGALYRTYKANQAGGEVVDGKVVKPGAPMVMKAPDEPKKQEDGADPKGASFFKKLTTFVWPDAKQDDKPAPMMLKKQDAEVSKDDNAANRQTSQTSNKTAENKQEASIDALVTKMDENNRSAQESAADMQLAINMFVGAVSTFSNAIDQRAAWAAWAGEVGRAGGLKATDAIGGNAKEDSERNQGIKPMDDSKMPTQYDNLLAEAAKKYNLDFGALKRQAWAESRFNPNAKSEAGAEGFMQIMPATQKALGVKNPFDARESIMAGARLMRENLDATNGNLFEALQMYHGGTDRRNWGPIGRKYASQITSPQNITKGVSYDGGMSRDKLQFAMVQNNLATALGVPLSQLQHGAVNRGDVEWKSAQIQAGLHNKIFDTNMKLAQVGLPQQERSRLQTELQEQETGLRLMKKYSPAIEAQAQQGERSITFGERAVVINVNGAFDPGRTAEAVRDTLQGSLGDLVNSAEDGVKY